MKTFFNWLESGLHMGVPLYKNIERYVDKLYDNGVDEEQALQLTIKAFTNEIIDIGKPREKTDMDISVGHTPIDNRKSATNYIKNYIRLVYRPETFE